MRKIVLLLSALLATQVFGAEQAIGVITSAGASTTNASTAAPFSIQGNTKLSIQCDAIAFVKVGDSVQGVTATTSATGSSVKILADQLFLTSTATEQNLIAIISASGTANCRVFTRRGDEG